MKMSDMLYFTAIIIAIVSLVLSFNVRRRFKKWSKPNCKNVTGREMAELMLQRAGIYDVAVSHTPGILTDHYNPSTKTVCLSDGVYDKATVAAVAVAAHECGHAIQHHEEYGPLAFRHKLAPLANIGSNAGIWIFIIGVAFVYGGVHADFILNIGIALFALATLFHIVTLPVEFNASNRALKYLNESLVLVGSEVKGGRTVLSSAALTYVAAAASSIITLLRLIAIKNRD